MHKSFSILVLVLLCLLFPGSGLDICLASTVDINSDRDTIKVLIDKGEVTEAKSKTEQLLTDHAQDVNLAKILYQVAHHYDSRGQNALAKQYYNRINELPNSSAYSEKVPLILSRMDIFARIDKGEINFAKSSVEQLVADYGDHPYLPNTLYSIASRYSSRLTPAEAIQLYNRIENLFPQNKHSTLSQLQVSRLNAISHIDFGDLSSAQADINQMISAHSDNKYLPAMLYSIATHCDRRAKQVKARELHNQVISQYPQSRHATLARMELCKMRFLSHLDWGRLDAARAEVERLKNDFYDDPSLPEKLANIASIYNSRQRASETIEVYNYIKSRFPQNFYSSCSELLLQRTYILSDINHGKVSQAETKVETLISDYADHSYLPLILHTIATSCFNHGQPDMAKQLLNRMINDYPESYYSHCAQMDILRVDIHSHIKSGGFPSAQSLINTLVSDYARHPRLTSMLYNIASYYSVHRKYDQAESIYNQLIQQDPHNYYSQCSTLWIARMDAISAIESGDITTAQSIVDTMITDHRNHPILAHTLYTIANEYLVHRKAKQASTLFNQLIDLFDAENDRYRMFAKQGLARIDITRKLYAADQAGAVEGIEKTITTYRNTSSLAVLLRNIAKVYFENRNYEKQIEIYKRILAECSYDEYQCFLTRVSLAKTNIDKQISEGDLVAADSAITQLRSDYAAYNNLIIQLYCLAQTYAWYDYSDKAIPLYQEVISDGSNKSFVDHCHRHIERLQLRQFLKEGDLSGARQFVNQFRNDYTGRDDLKPGLFWLAEEYYHAGLRDDAGKGLDYLQEVVAICEQEGMEHIKEDGIQFAAYGILSESHAKLDNYTKSIECYQNMIDKYEYSKEVVHAQFMVGRTVEKQIKGGMLSKSEGYPLVHQAYSTLLEKYPDCKAKPIVEKWLAKNSMSVQILTNSN